MLSHMREDSPPSFHFSTSLSLCLYFPFTLSSLPACCVSSSGQKSIEFLFVSLPRLSVLPSILLAVPSNLSSVKSSAAHFKLQYAHFRLETGRRTQVPPSSASCFDPSLIVPLTLMSCLPSKRVACSWASEHQWSLHRKWKSSQSAKSNKADV